MKKLLAIIMALLMVAAFGTMSVFASEEEAEEKEGIDISTATPEEIEEIGMAALLDAGLVSEGDVEIIDVTPQAVTDEKDEKAEAAEEKSTVNALSIVNLVLIIILLLAVALLYFFCWKKGIIDFSVFNFKTKK